MVKKTSKREPKVPKMRCYACVREAVTKCSKCGEDLCKMHTFYEREQRTPLCFSCLFFPKDKEQQ